MNRDEPHLRPARAEDCERVWRWNFAPDVRAMAGSAEPVPYTRHAAWFAGRLLQPASQMWIIEVAAAPVGVVRVDVGAATSAWGGVIEAQIHPDNHASRACFEACGFRATTQPTPAADTLLSYSWSP